MTSHCGATTKAGGKCKRPAGWGTPHVGHGTCKLHGGCTPSAVIAGAKAEVAAVAARFGGTPVPVAPELVFLRELYRTAAQVEWLAERIASFPTVGTSEVWTYNPRIRTEDGDIIPPGWVASFERTETGLIPLGHTLPGAGGGLSVHPSEFQAWLKYDLELRAHLVKMTDTAMKLKLEVRKIDLVKSMAADGLKMARAMVEATSPGLDPNSERYRTILLAGLSAIAGPALEGLSA